MMSLRKVLTHFVSFVLVAAFATSVFAQGRASLRGLITDEFGAAIVGATVTLTDAAGAKKTATTNADGTYSFTGLTPGKFTIHAIAKGFAASEDAEVDVSTARRDPFNISLKIAAIETQVKVEANAPLSTETGNNANQQVISGKDLEGLPDDPDELAAALQALAGPSIGPNGGQIFIDGFSGANMPPKESIREIRINQNPFSPENDQPSARIEILTKPGTDKLRGNVSFNFSDESLNSRNPFAVSSSKRSPFQIRQLGGNLSGPLIKNKASFFFEVNRNETDDNELVRATILDPAFNITQVGISFLQPRRQTSFSPRIDFAINSHNTLIARYNYNRNETKNNGVGGFSLPERGYNFTSTNQNVQLTETAVINATTINETRFQFAHGRNESLGNSSIPVLNVSGAFISGGSQVGHAINESNRWELNNFTQMQRNLHTFKFGGRIRHVRINDLSPNNFGGQWSFTGGFGPALDANNNPIAGTTIQLSSIDRYRRTALFQQQGLTAQQQAYCDPGSSVAQCIRTLGGGASQFSINTGNAQASVSQTDLGVYWQDDWRLRPNFTVSYGLRYETQTNAHSKYDFAPRVAFAWSPGGGGSSTRPPKMVIRGGGGIFYNRFGENQTLQANRFNGANELQFVVTEPVLLKSPGLAVQAGQPVYSFLNTYPAIPAITGVPASQQTIWRVAPNLQVPTVYLLGAQVERQLPKNFTAYVGVYTLRILHSIRARDINAPLPGSFSVATPNGVRPIPALGDIDQYEASGKFRQSQMFIGFNSRLNPAFTLSGNYVLSKTSNDTDGQGGSLFPMNSYDLRGEYGRGGFDIRHRFTLFGTFNSPWWKLVFNPFIVANSGPPFNITTGVDSNLDRQYNERPSFASANADCTSLNIRCTRFGNFNLTPGPGDQIIPRNYGHSPGSLSVNLRISRIFSFGGEAARSKASAGNQKSTTDTSKRGGDGGGGGGRGGPTIGAGMPGGGDRKGPGGGGPGMGGFGGGGNGAGKYSLTLAVNFQNILNHVNLGTPVGNLSSPNFGQSLGLAGIFGGFGGFGGGGGGGGGTGSGNRKVYLNVRFNF
ncbi:MAG TPA: carboxypeptidase regulatory-like domain-containing protein [Pyrinomonadaceae bacterium]|nr:carboxypeptidase regulatory-like domain-containing protein [Pyrinomonadaceae bacterium]